MRLCDRLSTFWFFKSRPLFQEKSVWNSVVDKSGEIGWNANLTHAFFRICEYFGRLGSPRSFNILPAAIFRFFKDKITHLKRFDVFNLNFCIFWRRRVRSWWGQERGTNLCSVRNNFNSDALWMLAVSLCLLLLLPRHKSVYKSIKLNKDGLGGRRGTKQKLVFEMLEAS